MGSYKRIKKPSFQPSKASQNPNLQQKREPGMPQQQPKGQTLEEMEIARKNAERLGDHMFDFSSTSPPGVQAKLNVGEAGDKYEQEADSVASQVVEEINSSQGEVGPSVMRQCEVCEAEKEKPSTSLQRQGEVAEGKALDGFLHDNERVGQDGFIYQGDYAQELTPMVQPRREQINSFAVPETGQRETEPNVMLKCDACEAEKEESSVVRAKTTVEESEDKDSQKALEAREKPTELDTKIGTPQEVAAAQLAIPFALLGTLLVAGGATGIIVQWEYINGTVVEMMEIAVDWTTDTASEITDRLIEAVGDIGVVGHSALRRYRGAIKNAIQSLLEQNKPRRKRCEYVGEFGGASGVKTCSYNCRGYGALANFGWPANQPCPPSFEGDFPGP